MKKYELVDDGIVEGFFNQHRYEETAIVCLLLDKQGEYIKDTSKTFEDGIKFCFLTNEAIFYYRCLKQLRNGEKLTVSAQKTVNYCNEFTKLFGLEQIFDIDYIQKNVFNILKVYEDFKTKRSNI